MSDPIASGEFVGITRDGEEVPITVTISQPRPFDDAEDASAEQGPPDMMCSVAVSPWRTMRVGGVDSLQALLQATHLIQQILRSFEAEGGRIYARHGRYRIDVDSPQLSPMVPLNKDAWWDGSDA